MRVLLDQPGETFSEATQVRSKNKSLEELLPFAKAWFKGFLEKRKYFEVPGVMAYVQKYNIIMDTLGMWPENTWDQIADKPRLGLINFCFVLGQDLKAKSSVAKLFFKDFMDSLRSDGPSILDDLDVRVWICGNKKDERQVCALIERSPFAKEYKTFNSTYILGKYERLDDLPASNKLLKEPVELIILVKKGLTEKHAVPKEYRSPLHVANTKVRKYNKFKYRVYKEFTMEFYFQVLKECCKPGDLVFTAFAGTKFFTASIVHSPLLLLLLQNQLGWS